ncbi:conjugal transfer protein TraD [Bradyrhizobium sp. USDA 4369]
MRTWQVERRKRTRHLIELGDPLIKARVVELTGDDRAMICCALLRMAAKIEGDQSEHARKLWAEKGMLNASRMPSTARPEETCG